VIGHGASKKNGRSILHQKTSRRPTSLKTSG
jgi:hypothetical protein